MKTANDICEAFFVLVQCHEMTIIKTSCLTSTKGEANDFKYNIRSAK